MEALAPDTYQPPYLAQRVLYALAWGSARLLLDPIFWARDVYFSMRHPESYPDVIKSYDARPSHPVRIFYPRTHKETVKHRLPVVFTVHGGGFSMLNATDDDRWNRFFADSQEVVVIGLNHSHAPFNPYPAALHDLEAVLLAIVEDETVHVDWKRTAIGGSSSGANLALAVCQLESIKEKLGPKAAFSSCGLLHVGGYTNIRPNTRRYKEQLGSVRGAQKDMLQAILPSVNWGYTPRGTRTADPLYSPYYASADDLPPHLFFIGAELDILGHENWQMACRLAGRPIPSVSDKLGRDATGDKGMLELSDERFVFEHIKQDRAGNAISSVKWLLVPDVIHGFDWRNPDAASGTVETIQDAQMKAEKTLEILGEWLHNIVWK